MIISYAITVKDEIEQIKLLLQHIFLYKQPQDEVVIAYDSKSASKDVKQFLDSINNKNFTFYSYEIKDNFYDLKNFLISKCTGEYIFNFDADEFITKQQHDNILSILRNNEHIDVFIVPRINIIQDISRELSSYYNIELEQCENNLPPDYPDYRPRLFKNKETIKWANNIHEFLVGGQYVVQFVQQHNFSFYQIKTFKKHLKQNIKIFIPHYTKLVDRKSAIKKILLDEGFENFTFFELFDKEMVDESRFSNDENLKRSKIEKFIPETVIKNFLVEYKKGMTQGEKSLLLKHENIYKTFLESSSDNDILVVLEDDVRLCHNFKKYIEILCEKYVFDCLNLSAGALYEIVPTITNPLTQLHTITIDKHPFNSGTDSYIMTRNCVEHVYQEIINNKLCLPIDWELSHIFMSLKDIKCKRTNPPLCYQASQIGEYESSIKDRKNVKFK